LKLSRLAALLDLIPRLFSIGLVFICRREKQID
jgi:hypothetical protein